MHPYWVTCTAGLGAMRIGDDGTTTQAQAAVWCGTCGIPYAAETVYCANCGAPLAALADELGVVSLVSTTPGALMAPAVSRTAAPDDLSPAALAAPDQDAPLVALAQERLSDGAGAGPLSVAPPGVHTLDEAFPHPPRGLLDRVRQRQRAMSEDEIDAAAAAIIAQARHADRLAAATGTPRDALAPLADLAPDPVVREALQGRRDRDRAWLIGGLVCCVLLILFALVISRSMSIGMLRQ